MKASTLFLSLLLYLLSSCQPGVKPTLTPGGNAAQANLEKVQTTVSVPTIASFFIKQENTPVLLPTTAPSPTTVSTFEIKHLDTNTRSVPIYTDTLNPDWEIVKNTEVDVSETGRPNTYEGRSALQVTPRQDFGQLIFLVKPDAKHTYLRSQVLALSFWLSGGPNYIATDNLAVTVFGSNKYPYYVADDHSAWESTDSPFSETRLYYLGLNDAIPPNTWAEVVNWLNDREFDPVYKYITGFYIKNDEGFENTYFIDDISFIMIDDGSEPTPSTKTIVTPTANK